MHKKADMMGITERVAPFMYWLRVATVDPQQGIAALASVDLANSTLTQRQRIRTSLVPPPTPPQPPRREVQVQQPLQLPEPSQLLAPENQAAMPAERLGVDLSSLLHICNFSTMS